MADEKRGQGGPAALRGADTARATAPNGKRRKTPSDSFPILEIGAPAGGPEAFTHLFSNLPDDTGMAFVLVPDFDSSQAARLPELLSRYTRMPVVEAQDKTEVEPDHVYVIPADRSVSISQGELHLLELKAPRNQSEDLASERTTQLDEAAKELTLEIAQRREAEEALKASEERYRDLVENLHDVIYATDVNGVVTYISPAAEAILGFRPPDITGHSFFEFVPPEDALQLRERFQQALEGRVEFGEHRFLTRSGQVRWGRSSGRPVVQQGRVTGLQGVFTDITERKRAEQELHTISRRLIRVQEEERRAIARELHDDIGQSLVFLKLSIDRAVGVFSGKSAEFLNQAAAELAKLTEQVRNLSQDLRPPMLESLGLRETLLSHFERYTAQTGVEVKFKHSGLDGRLAVDESIAVFRVIQEALTNVARHSGAGEVYVNLRADAHSITIDIKDRGRGFDTATLASSAANGLAGMSERLRLVGGALDLRSTPGGGTVLRVTMPVEGI